MLLKMIGSHLSRNHSRASEGQSFQGGQFNISCHSNYSSAKQSFYELVDFDVFDLGAWFMSLLIWRVKFRKQNYFCSYSPTDLQLPFLLGYTSHLIFILANQNKYSEKYICFSPKLSTFCPFCLKCKMQVYISLVPPLHSF